MVTRLTKDQPVARRRAVAMTGRSKTVRMTLDEEIERPGLTADQASAVFPEEMVRYRTMLPLSAPVDLAGRRRSARRETVAIEDICGEAADRVEAAEKGNEAVDFAVGSRSAARMPSAPPGRRGW